MSKYCIYLRKSRKDAEAEMRGEGETLAKHKKILKDTAMTLNIDVDTIYEEIVSGDTIASRPVMQTLISEVEQGKWTGVLVVEIERLARGDTIDQGIVAQAFKYSNTKIITPMKTYDPSNEFDEEYFEFGLFMSRREFVTIKRRLIRGREAAAKEGKFVGSIAPYGYERIKIPNDKGYTLQIVPEQAKIVELIFKMYVTGVSDIEGAETRVGIQKMARILNQLGIPSPRYDYWQKSTLRDIIINPTYAGMIRWGWRKTKKHNIDREKKQSRPRNYNDDCICVQGIHPPIIDITTFELAQQYIDEIPPVPVGYKKELKNPLAGLIYCKECGRSMVLRKGNNGKPDYLVCHARNCKTVSSPFDLVEKRVLHALKEWLKGYKINIKSPEKIEVDINMWESVIEQKEKEIITLSAQLDKVYSFLEQQIYTKDEFVERSTNLKKQIDEAHEAIKTINSNIEFAHAKENERKLAIPRVESLLESYYNMTSSNNKNRALKEVVDKIVYSKYVHGGYKNTSADDFTLELFPKLSQY